MVEVSFLHRCSANNSLANYIRTRLGHRSSRSGRDYESLRRKAKQRRGRKRRLPDVSAPSSSYGKNCPAHVTCTFRAPEFRFPYAIHDSFDALKWCKENAEQLGVDPNRIIVAGSSAGGNMVRRTPSQPQYHS